MVRKFLGICLLSFAFVLVYFGQSLKETTSTQRLVWWHVGDSEEVFQEAINQFKADKPAVEFQFRQFPYWDEYLYYLSSEYQKGRSPDVLSFDESFRHKVQAYLEPESYSLNKRYNNHQLITSLESEESDIEERLWYGSPLWVDPLMLLQNRRFISEDQVREQWYDYGEMTKQLYISGVAMGQVDTIALSTALLTHICNQYLIELQGQSFQKVLDETFVFYKRFANPSDPFFNWSQLLVRNDERLEIGAFRRGKVASIFAFSQQFHQLYKDLSQGSDVARTPLQVSALSYQIPPQFNQSPYILSKYTSLGVSKLSPDKDLAVQFIDTLTRESFVAQRVKQTFKLAFSNKSYDFNTEYLQKFWIWHQNAFNKYAPNMLNNTQQEQFNEALRLFNTDA